MKQYGLSSLIERGGVIMTRVKETIERHDKGYNCAQSVACTYADLVGLDEATMFKVTEGLRPVAR